MGRRGPAPKPTKLRLLHGDEERRINRNEPQPTEGPPEAPAELDETSRAVWDYIVGELDAMGLANRPDRDQLFAYCEAVSLHAKAVKMVHAAGPLIKDKDGYVRLNPAVRVQHQSARTMMLYAREFGLTPAARVHLTAQKVAEDHAERLLS
jgi:P27 family predicted phage terminase small subunit